MLRWAKVIKMKTEKELIELLRAKTPAYLQHKLNDPFCMLEIVRMVEETLDDDVYTEFDIKLFELDALNGRYASSKWNTRALALHEIGVI